MKALSKSSLSQARSDLEKTKYEISKAVIGQDEMIEKLLKALLANGHVLIEGIPGIAKTLLTRALAKASGCSSKRIQFTADLLPTDIVGITSYEENKGFFVIKGPIFSNFILADEINRAPPKVQSGLLEAMQERQATIGKETFPMEIPFFVLATENSIETLGTYPLPEAQVDRFLFKLIMGYPKKEEEKMIIENNTSLKPFDEYDIKPILSPQKIIDYQEIAKKIAHSDKIKEYIVNLVHATRDFAKYNIKTGRFIELGASPRASISLFIAAKADAFMKGEPYIRPENVKHVAHDVLRHRIILNYEGQAEQIKTDDIIGEVLSKVPIP